MSVIRIRKAASDDPILQVADRMAPKMRQAFLDAVAAASKSLPLTKIADAIRAGNTQELIHLLDGAFVGALQGAGLAAGVASLRDAVQATFAAAAKAAMAELPARVSVGLSFNLLNPAAINWLNNYTFDLIRQVSADTRAAVQQVILRGFQDGRAPIAQAREIRTMIGLTVRQERAIENYRAALEGGNFQTALERALRDARGDRTLLSAMANERQLTAGQVDSLVERYRARYLQYRAQTIARTESIRASNAGQRELWRQAREQGLLGDNVRREWIVSGDDRTCEVCDGLDGETAGIDEEFAPGILMPPDPHPDCRCTTGLVFGRAEEAA